MGQASLSWSGEAAAQFEGPRVFDHGLSAGFADDAALVELLDRYPADLFDINRYDFDAEGQVALTTGDRGKADGAAVLAAIKAGQLWVNLRGVDEAHPALWREAVAAFRRIAPQIGAERATRMTGQLILSSPATKVPFHFDPAGVMLFHLRGEKRVFVYPNDEAHLPQASVEQVIMRTSTEELPYARSYDARAAVVDLKPGQALTWPLYAPHRVENSGVFNVSLSMDFQTWSTRLLGGAHCAHGVMRRWGRPIRPMGETPAAARAALWAASLAMKRAGLVETRIRHFERDFELAAAQ